MLYVAVQAVFCDAVVSRIPFALTIRYAAQLALRMALWVKRRGAGFLTRFRPRVQASRAATTRLWTPGARTRSWAAGSRSRSGRASASRRWARVRRFAPAPATPRLPLGTFLLGGVSALSATSMNASGPGPWSLVPGPREPQASTGSWVWIGCWF